MIFYSAVLESRRAGGAVVLLLGRLLLWLLALSRRLLSWGVGFRPLGIALFLHLAGFVFLLFFVATIGGVIRFFLLFFFLLIQ